MPFYLRTGKRLARKVTEIAVTLKPVPHLAFQIHGAPPPPNQLVFQIQPNEGVSISLGAKIPGAKTRIRPVNMEFQYGTSFTSESPEAYERLILDAMRGDATLFTRVDEVEALWEIVDPGARILGGRPREARAVRGRLERAGRSRRTAAGQGQMATALTTPGVWSARDTTPAEIEAALLRLMHEQANEGMVHAPARVLNLVVVIDREWKGEISNRLDRINRDNPSRTILIVVEDGQAGPRRDGHADPRSAGRSSAATRSFASASRSTAASTSSRHLDTIIYPVLATEVGTVVWSPHGHPEAVDALRGLATTVLIDSLDIPDWHDAIARISELSEHADVSDLAWLRSNPWRERVAAAFDPVVWRPELDAINRVVVRMHPGSTLAALLWLGWIASRLEWTPHVLELDADIDKSGFATGPAGQIELLLENDDTMPVPGLSGLTIETTNGLSLSLDRGVGGLRATRVLPGGGESDWTILGASRGEDGILAHGVTNALIPDPLFRPALEAACAFGGRASIAKVREQ